jgi:hypothetical protein
MYRAQIFKFCPHNFGDCSREQLRDVLTVYVQRCWTSNIKRGDIIDINIDNFTDRFVWDGEKVVELETNSEFFDGTFVLPPSFVCDDVMHAKDNIIPIASPLYWEKGILNTSIIWFSERLRRETADRLKRVSFQAECLSLSLVAIPDRFVSSFTIDGKNYPFFMDTSFCFRFDQPFRLSLKRARELIMNTNIPFQLSDNKGEYLYTLAHYDTTGYVATYQKYLKTAPGVVQDIEQEKKRPLFVENRRENHIQARDHYMKDLYEPVVFEHK